MMTEEEFYAEEDKMMEELEREQQAAKAAKPLTRSAPYTRQSTFNEVSSKGNATTGISAATGMRATSLDALNHSIADSSSISGREQSRRCPDPRDSEQNLESKKAATSKRSASPTNDPPRKRTKKDEKTHKVDDFQNVPESDDISMFTESSSSIPDITIVNPIIGMKKTLSRKKPAASSSSKQSASSQNGKLQRDLKPIKMVPIDNAFSSMQNKVPREETGKSKAVAQRAQAPHGRTPLTFSSHISDVDKRSRSASVSGCEGPSTSQSKVLREEKGKAKKAPPCLPVFDGRTPLNFVPLATPSISSKTSGACSANSNATKKAPLTKQASRPKTVKPLTAKQIREKYRGMVLRDFLQDIFQRRDAGDFAMKTPFLRGKVFFYCPQDYSSMTETSRKRSELLVRHGATVQLDYDPTTVTHIIAEGSEANVTKRLGIKSIMDIPEHVPTVTWEWVSVTANGYIPGARRKDGSKAYLHPDFFPDCNEYAAFAARKKKEPSPEIISYRKHPPVKPRRPSTPPPPQRSVSDTETDNDEPIVKKRSRPQLLTPSNSSGDELNLRLSSPEPVASSSKVQRQISSLAVCNDPLAEFYSQAQKEYDEDTAFGRNYNKEEENDDDDEKSRGPPAKRGWTCDKPFKPNAKQSPNQDIADKLEELKMLHEKKPGGDNRVRAFSYQRSIPRILAHPTRIKSLAEARDIPGVGERTAEKIMEIINTGDLQRIKHENTEDVKVAKIFTGIYGVGQNIAMQWYANGLRTLEDVRQHKFGIKLSSCQEIGLQFYDDINSRMPRDEAGAIYDLIKPIALKIDNQLTVDIMGSYRRGKADCGDIDILITRPIQDGKTHYGVMNRLWRDLHAAEILTDDLSLPEDMNALECCYRGLCKLPGAGSRRRRLDILMVPWKCRGAALLYYTGDDIFNRAMRLKANKMGYSLNQRGLYAGVVRNPRDRREKTNKGNIVASQTEREIFDILKVPWQEPWQRVRSG